MPPLSVGQCANLACLLEATAPKPGNVHRGADFENLTYLDFALSAVLIGPHMEAAAAGQRLGPTVLNAVTSCRDAVGTNSNLGMILLLAPLAIACRGASLREALPSVLADLDGADSQGVYEAIRYARPGGLGRVEQHDIADAPPERLLDAMRMAAERDLIARQYANGFHEVFDFVAPAVQSGLRAGWRLSDAIVHAQLQTMSRYPDSLIERKCGASVAAQAADRAAEALGRGCPGEIAYHESLAELDFWLRGDHHRRNPGTTADLLAAGLFVLLREGSLTLPLNW